MKTSAQGLALIRACEGCKLKAYRDAVNVLTIGVGHTTAAGPPVVTVGMTITDAEADRILANDLAACERDVERLVKVALNQGQFDALVSWVFNLGAGNLSSSTLLKRLNAGLYSAAADEFLKWNHAGGRVLAGLTKRRKAERLLFLGQSDEALKMVGAKVPPAQPVVPQGATPAPKAVGAAASGMSAAIAAHRAGFPLWAVVAAALAAAAVGALVLHFLLKSKG